MCGDTNCPSCGPAQGIDPSFDVIAGWMEEVVLVNMPHCLDLCWLAEELAHRLGSRSQPQYLADAILKAAHEWEQNGA
jgi:hypothetical protein